MLLTSPRPAHLHGDHAAARRVAALRAVLAALRGRGRAQRTQAVEIPRRPQLGPPRRPVQDNNFRCQRKFHIAWRRSLLGTSPC